MTFLFRDDQGKELLTRTRRGEDEPYILIEETRDAPDGDSSTYNYDVILPAHGYHFGLHYHMHENRLYPHRQGFGVPGGLESYAKVDLERDTVFWSLVTKAFEIDAVANP